MGSTKEWALMMQESRRDDWILENISDPDLEPDSEEWNMLAQEYDDYQEFISDMAMEAYQEEKWLKDNPHTDIYSNSINLLNEVKDADNQETTEIFIKMKIAYYVTIMESCLSEMIKSVVLSDSIFLDNSIRNIKELAGKKIPITDLINKELTASKYVQEHLSDILYHKVINVVEIYKAILQPKNHKKIILKNIIELVRLRHDIVHRNGRDTDGNMNEINALVLADAHSTVISFLTDINNMINDSIENNIK